MFCPHSPQWRVPHQEAAGQLPGDVGEHLPASVWSHHRPPQSPRAPPLLRTRQCLFTPSIHTRSWRLTLLWWRCFFFFLFLSPLVPTGGGLRQRGRRVQTWATHLQPGQSAAGRLDRGEQPPLLLLPVLHLRQHDCAEPPEKVEPPVEKPAVQSACV